MVLKTNDLIDSFENHCAAVVGYIYVFGSGLLGEFLLTFFVEDTGFPSKVLSFITTI
jgi:hypothetical protein